MKFKILEVAVRFLPQSNVAKAICAGGLVAVCFVWIQSAYADSEQDPLTAFSLIYPIMSDYFRRKIVFSIFLTAFFCNMAPVLDQIWDQVIEYVQTLMDGD